MTMISLPVTREGYYCTKLLKECYMADEIALLPKYLERSIVNVEVLVPPKDKWYEYQSFSLEGSEVVLLVTLSYKQGMRVNVKCPVTGHDAPSQFIGTGDVTFNLLVDDERYDIHASCPFTVHVYERWMIDMFLVSTTKMKYDYDTPFHLSDIHIGGHSNVPYSPYIYPTSGWTANIAEGTHILADTQIEVSYTENTRDENFNIVPRTYTAHYTAKVGDRLDGIDVNNLTFNPHEAPNWEGADFFELYNNGTVVKTAEYGDWDYYYPTTPIETATMYDGKCYVGATARYRTFEWSQFIWCNANDYKLYDDSHRYDMSSYLTYKGTSVEIDAPWIRQINDVSYANNTYLKKLTLGSIIRMDTGSFSGCTNLEELHIPKCTYLSTPFNGCTNLEVIDAPNLEDIDDDVFNGCTANKDVILPNCINIGARAFRNNYIRRVNLPSIESLGDACFYGAHVDIRKVYLGSLTAFPQSVFEEATINTSINDVEMTFPNIETVGYMAFHNARGNRLTLNLPNVTDIQGSAFRWDEHIGSNRMTAVECPNVLTIGSRAFEGFYLNSGTELSFTKCTDVGEHAFERCIGLEKIDLNSCTYIHNYAFEECKNLVEMKITTGRCLLGSGVFQYEDGDVYARCNPNLKVWVQNRFKQDYKTDSSMGWTYIADHIYGIGEGVVTLDDDSITSISDYEWSYLNDLKHVILDNCTEIGDYGFYCDYYLEDLSLPKAETIGDHAFGCDLDTIPSRWQPLFTGTLSLPSAKTIGIGAFASYKLGGDGVTPNAWATYRFTSLHAPNLEEIGNYAFVGNSFTGAMNLPRLRSIGVHALRTTAITSLNVPNLVTVGQSAFANCSLLTELDLPKAETIGVESFNNCRNITTVNMPRLTSIGRNAFWSCSSLVEAIVGTETDTMCTADYTPFPSTIQSIWVKDELVDTYKADARWSTYASVIKPISERTTE